MNHGGQGMLHISPPTPSTRPASEKAKADFYFNVTDNIFKQLMLFFEIQEFGCCNINNAAKVIHSGRL